MNHPCAQRRNESIQTVPEIATRDKKGIIPLDSIRIGEILNAHN
jgi:hypothetical protein